MCLRPQLLLATFACLLWSIVTQAVDSGNEVAVWIEQGQAVATSPISGRREIPLDVQETVIGSVTNGINAVVVTSLGIHERVTRLDNENSLIIVTTNDRTLVFGSRLSGWEEFE